MGNRIRQIEKRAALLLLAMLALTIASTQMRADTGSCGGASIALPFTDVMASPFFCQIAAAYFSGLTNGTSATTYSPTQPVTREQMAAFVSRTHDSALKQGNRRAAMQQWWTPRAAGGLRPVSLGSGFQQPIDIVFDGTDLWTANQASDTVSRVTASSGRLQATWSGIPDPKGIIACAGRIFVTSHQGAGLAGRIYVINPEVAGNGTATVFEPNIGVNPLQITYDGANLWTANATGGGDGSISRINVSTAADITFTIGFVNPTDILWDGTNLWVADPGAGSVKRVDPVSGAVLEDIPVLSCQRLLFDGTNLWGSKSVTDDIVVIRAVGGLRGTVLATITGNGLDGPAGMAFDGERVLVCNVANNSVSLFKAADFTPLTNLFIGTFSDPFASCSDGVNFWIARFNNNDIVRF